MGINRNDILEGKRREDIVEYPNNPSLLDLMKQPDTLKVALPESQSDKDALHVISKLSQTCHTFHSLFQAQAVQLAAKKLCQHVVYGEKSEAEKLLAQNPLLLLVKIQVTDEAGRKILGTAFQIALGAKDVSPFPNKFNEMTEMIAGYFEKIPDGDKEKQTQYAMQFPEGFEKLEEERQARDSKALHTLFAAIKNASTIVSAKDAVEVFLNDLKAQTQQVIKTGYHFNEALFEEALSLYIKNYMACGGDFGVKNKLVTVKVLGGIQCYFTANLAQAMCDGFDKLVKKMKVLSRSKSLTTRGISFFDTKLGVDHFVDGTELPDGVFARRCGRRSRWAVARAAFFKTYVKLKQRSWKNYATTLGKRKSHGM